MSLQLQLREGETALTVESAARSIGHYVRVIPGSDLAIIIKSAGTGLLVRYTGDKHRKGTKHHYLTVSLDGVALIEPGIRVRPDWLAEQVANYQAGRRVVADLLPVVMRILDPTFVPGVEVQAYETFQRERGELLDGDERSRARLERIFEGYAEYEARWLEDRQLQAELDARVRRG